MIPDLFLFRLCGVVWKKRNDKTNGRSELQPLSRILDCDCVDLVLGEATSFHLGNDVAYNVRVAVTAELNLEFESSIKLELFDIS